MRVAIGDTVGLKTGRSGKVMEFRGWEMLVQLFPQDFDEFPDSPNPDEQEWLPISEVASVV